MNEGTNTPTAPAQAEQEATALPTLPVTRETDGKTTTVNFVPTQVKRGKNAGTWYLHFPLSKENFQEAIDFLGIETAIQWLSAKLRLIEQDAANDATDKETMVFNPEKFRLSMANLTVRGLTISDLEDQIDENLEQLVKLDLSNPDNFVAAQKIQLQVKQLREQIAQKERPGKKEVTSTSATSAPAPAAT